MSTPPTFEQVRALPRLLQRDVPAHFADANGHMNIVRYMELYNEATWTAMAAFGLGESDAAAGRAASMAVEHHVRYLREVHVGDVVACHVRVVGRSSKAVHQLYLLANVTTGVLASTLETLELSVDLAARRVAPFPAHVAELLDARIAVDEALPWTSPTSGAIRAR
ncbi:MAG: thioesterase family protein [Micrococcales bacterium]|nr:thioesterase family protein [Micrococcales bacterium]